jgi:hypothetical protein
MHEPTVMLALVTAFGFFGSLENRPTNSATRSHTHRAKPSSYP